MHMYKCIWILFSSIQVLENFMKFIAIFDENSSRFWKKKDFRSI